MKALLSILSTSVALARQPSLSPNVQVNGLFERLVKAVTDGLGSGWIAQTPLAWKTRRLSGQGETELEYFWAERILSARDIHQEIKAFPYLGHYERLCERELELAQAQSTKSIKRILFIGCGPLPLSAILLARKGYLVEAVDRDPRACELAQALVERLGLSSVLSIRCEEAEQVHAKAFDLLILAALVGNNGKSKTKLMETLLKRVASSALLLARSAHGWRSFLYPPIPVKSVQGGELCSVFHPKDDMINSVLIFRPSV